MKPERSRIRTTYSVDSSGSQAASSPVNSQPPCQPSMGVQMRNKKASAAKKNASTQWERSFIEQADAMISDKKCLAPFLDSINIDNLPVPIVTSTFVASTSVSARGSMLNSELSSPISTRSKSKYVTVMSSVTSDSFQYF